METRTETGVRAVTLRLWAWLATMRYVAPWEERR